MMQQDTLKSIIFRYLSHLYTRWDLFSVPTDFLLLGTAKPAGNRVMITKIKMFTYMPWQWIIWNLVYCIMWRCRKWRTQSCNISWHTVKHNDYSWTLSSYSPIDIIHRRVIYFQRCGLLKHSVYRSLYLWIICYLSHWIIHHLSFAI